MKSSERNPQKKSERESASESSREDDKLVAAAVEGDESAYAQLVDKYQRALFYHIAKLVKDKEQIEDLVQEAFMKAFGNLKSYNTDYAFSTWLYRIATNHSIDYLRKRKLQTLSIDEPQKTKDGELEVQLPDDSYVTDRDIIRKQRKQIIHKSIENLPEKYREVIRMRHMEEKSYQEIAEILDLPLGTVKAHIFRAREMLYKSLKDKRRHF
jgi:RNA polymerase sigma factor (sigma-70 family)